jgi:birA, biotin-[acetyl-CoA-carboxylase] ligase region
MVKENSLRGVTMRNAILQMLKESRGFISGEEISSRLNVSRMAVCKHINALKSEGYSIESYPKKGYRLTGAPDILSPGEVLPVLNTRYIGRGIIHFDSIESTNNIARQKAAEGCPDGFLVIAEEQTAGRGRLGRRWVTPKSSSIAMSLVLKPNIAPNDAPGITLIAGLSVCRAIEGCLHINSGIKWPNDIIINGRKACGILTEMSAEMDAINYVIAGIGINVNIKEFPEDIKNIATSLCIEKGTAVSRKEVLSSVLLEFEGLYDRFKESGLSSIMDDFKAHSVTLGNMVRVQGQGVSFEGEAVDITGDGILLVRLSDGTVKKVISGDVSVRGINGYL